MKKFAFTLCAVLVATAAWAQTPPTQDPAKPAAPTAAAAPAAGAPTVAGNWNIQLDAGQGPMDIATTMKLDGKKITGMLSSPMGEVPLEGEVADGKVTFWIDFQGTPITFVGAFKDADTLSGTLNGPMGEIPWVGKRVKG